MNWKDACWRVTTEDKEQFSAALELLQAGNEICLDASFSNPADWRSDTAAAHERGLACGLRMPHIWRQDEERFFKSEKERLREAGFDFFLCRNMESLYYLEEHGLLENAGYALDHSIYVTNREAWRMLQELLPGSKTGMAACGTEEGNSLKKPRSLCASLELNEGELADLKEILQGETAFELTVYGRAPMMVSAQCVKRSSGNCDHRPAVLYLKDRTGSEMPVKNCCRFCGSTIYNAVPLVLYDLWTKERILAPDILRFEFTTESAKEVRAVMQAKTWTQGTFTRGHFRKSVQ